MRNTVVRFAALAAAAVVAGSAAACSAGTESPSASGPEKQETGTVTVTDQWVKAASSGMTGLFGTLNNSGSTEVTVVSASSPAAGSVELHEVVGPAGAGTMQPKQGGFVIPAGGSHTLAPGSDHLMLMDLKAPLQVGSDVEITLTFADGATLPFTAQVREFAGAGENYQPASPSAGAPARHSGDHPAGEHG